MVYVKAPDKVAENSKSYSFLRGGMKGFIELEFKENHEE